MVNRNFVWESTANLPAVEIIIRGYDRSEDRRKDKDNGKDQDGGGRVGPKYLSSCNEQITV
jgi:hypothetical protein